jgi:hypothetical protein
MEIHRVIENIRALTRKTIANGCTEGEAISAAAKIGELLKVYNLSMDKVFLGDAKCITSSIDTRQKRRHPVDTCVVVIAAFCDCRVWFSSSYQRTSIYNFFGLETDTEMAKYLYQVILNAILTETTNYKNSSAYRLPVFDPPLKKSRKSLSVSFQKGMARRISIRLREMKSARQNEEEEESPPIILAGSTGTSLVLVKRKKVEDEFEKLGLSIKRAARPNMNVNYTAYNDGMKAGNKVNLARPLNWKVVGYLK